MKHLNIISPLLILLLALTACKPPCKEVTCVNGACLEGNCLCNQGWTGPQCAQADQCFQRDCGHGYCTDGQCICDAYYEGTTCNTPIKEKYLGNWAVSETCNAGPTSYSSILADFSGAGPDEFRIYNLWVGGAATATIADHSFTFAVPRQAITQGYELETTSAMLNADATSITISYRIYTTGSTTVADACTATWTKY